MSDDVEHSSRAEGMKTNFNNCLLTILSAEGMSQENRATAVSALVEFYKETCTYLAGERFVASIVRDLLDIQRKM